MALLPIGGAVAVDVFLSEEHGLRSTRSGRRGYGPRRGEAQRRASSSTAGPPALEVLLVHPGGPFWAKRDAGAWSIPKGEYDDGEDPLAAARRELAEELGVGAPELTATSSTSARSARRPARSCERWALAGDLDPATLRQQHVRDGVAAALRPPSGVPGGRSRRVGRARPRRARLLLPAQAAFVDRLLEIVEPVGEEQ